MDSNISLPTSYPVVLVRERAIALNGPGLRTELLRKSIHLMIAVAPALAALDRGWTIALLGAGSLFYALAESARMAGWTVPVISGVTAAAARDRDGDRFVLGPVTLGLGAMLALLLYPNPASAVAIYALAFGDAAASLVGKSIGRIRPSWLFGKSVEGSLACFLVVFIAAFRVSRDPFVATAAAATAALTEALPLEDYDNIALPMAVGFVVSVLLKP
jgi:dolichol kinase